MVVLKALTVYAVPQNSDRPGSSILTTFDDAQGLGADI
jgi:hypothetical protein